MITASEFVATLQGVKRTPNGWEARCPAHEDSKQSLSIKDDPEKLIAHCHAGCSFEKIIAGYSSPAVSSPMTKQARKIKATYSYKDEQGVELFQTVRYEPKDFKQRHLHCGEWKWSLNGQRKVPYR